MTRPAPTLAPVPPPAPPAPELEPPDGALDLAEHLHVILDARWLVLGAVAAALALGGAWAWLATPIYRSDVLIQVEDKKAGMGALGDIAGVLGDTATPAETEIEIIRSRSVVGAVVDSLHLDVVAEPARLPVLGRALARRHEGDSVAAAPVGLGRYGWGGETLRVDRLEVPPALLGEKLTLVAGEAGRFESSLPAGLARRRHGRRPGHRRRRDPARLGAARPARHALPPRPPLPRGGHQGPAGRAARPEKGKKTGILIVSLEGPDRDRLAATLDALAAAYLRQNIERKAAEAGKTLQFLETQLPQVHASLEAAEAELERYQLGKGGLDVSLATQAMVARSVEVEKASSELQVEAAALGQRFTENHPAVKTIQDKLRRLDAERTAIEARLKALPRPSWRAPAGCATSRSRTSSTWRSSTGPRS